MDKAVRTRIVLVSVFLLSFASSVLVAADETAPINYPFLEWYGLWPGRSAIGEDGKVWTQDMPEGVHLAVQPARKSKIFITSENPWEESVVSPFTALRHEGRIKLWYLCSGAEKDADTFVAYAESDDGFVWQRPDVGLIEYQGSKQNNLLFRHKDFGTQSVFVDPSAPPEERYKALARDSVFYHKGVRQKSMTYERKWEIRHAMQAKGYTAQQMQEELYFELLLLGATSPDGLRWRFLEEPVLEFGRKGLDSQNIGSYDAKTGKYVAYLRRAKDRRRSVVRSEGDDFRKLGPANLFSAPTPKIRSATTSTLLPIAVIRAPTTT